MTFGELLGLSCIVLLGWFWLAGLKARDIGVVAAAQACQQEGLQFLDDTVSQAGLRLRRGENGRLRVQRTFAFEYSLTGNDRFPGSVTLLGQEVSMIDINTHTNVIDLTPKQLH